MKVLVACEESQVVTIELRLKGIEAYSCDLQPCSGGHPEWHIQGDAIHQLWNRKWDLVIAHPPCTYLSNSGVRWLASKKPKSGYEWSDKYQIYINPKRWFDVVSASKFFNQFKLYGKTGGCIAIENPIMHKYGKEQIFLENENPIPSQIIQPWMFGHGETKATCLWLYNIPKLKPTNIVEGREGRIWKMSPGPERTKLRSKTYEGIAQAMAEQWSDINEYKQLLLL